MPLEVYQSIVIHLCHFHITDCKHHRIPCKWHPKVNCPFCILMKVLFVTGQHHSIIPIPVIHPSFSSFLYSFFSSFFLSSFLHFLYLSLPLSPSIPFAYLGTPWSLGFLGPPSSSPCLFPCLRSYNMTCMMLGVLIE
jgi:hypothetical protein